MITVLANGCFDIIHVGHIMHLREAKSLGGRLIVALTEDEFVNKGSGRPVNKWEDRAKVLMALKDVDEVVKSKSCVDAIYKVRPNIFVKGIDYTGSKKLDSAREACRIVGARVQITKTPKYSTSEIIEKLT